MLFSNIMVARFYIPINIYPKWCFLQIISVFYWSHFLCTTTCDAFDFVWVFILLKYFIVIFFVFVQKMICFPKYDIHAYNICKFSHTYRRVNEHPLTTWLVHLIDCWFFSNVAWLVALWVTRLFFSYVYHFVC